MVGRELLFGNAFGSGHVGDLLIENIGSIIQDVTQIVKGSTDSIAKTRTAAAPDDMIGGRGNLQRLRSCQALG